MTKTIGPALTTSLSATVLAFVLQQPVLAEEAPATVETTPAPVEAQPATPMPGAQHPAAAARAAIEERRAARRAELDKRYEALRAEAESHGFEMPLAPPWAEGPQWLSYEEMQELMKAQGVELPGAADLDQALAPPAVPSPPMSAAAAEEQKRVFDIIGKMTPEQQKACFSISRWHAPLKMPHQMPRPYSQPQMPPYPRAYAPGYGQGYPGMMPPR
jgi:hypothetical protein